MGNIGMDFCAQEWIGREDDQGGLVGWIDIYLGFPCFSWMKTKRKRRPCGSCFEMPIKKKGVVTIIKATSPDSLRMKMNPCSKFYKSTHPSTHLPLTISIHIPPWICHFYSNPPSPNSKVPGVCPSSGEATQATSKKIE